MQYQPLSAGAQLAPSGNDAMHCLAANLSHMLRMTRALIASGRTVELTGLERQIGLLCAKALDLPPEEGRMLRPVLIHLLADLDSLSTTLAQQTAPIPDS